MATPTRGARLLQQLMDADPEVAEKLRAAIDRPAMWRFVHAKRRPSLDRAREIETLTGGRVPMSAWSEEEPVKPPSTCPCGKQLAATGTESA